MIKFDFLKTNEDKYINFVNSFLKRFIDCLYFLRRNTNVAT